VALLFIFIARIIDEVKDESEVEIMKRFPLIICVFLLFISGCINDQNKTNDKESIKKEDKISEVIKEAHLPKDMTITAIGDSLTQGVGDSTNSGGYLSYLSDELESLDSIKSVKVNNYGVRGNRSDQIVERLQTPEIQESIKKSDLVFVTVGGNDVMKVFKGNISNLNMESFNEEQPKFEIRLIRLLSQIRSLQPNVGIVLMGIYNPFLALFPEVTELNQIVQNWNGIEQRAIARVEPSLFIPINDLFIDENENIFYKDHFHPNDNGYKKISDRVYQRTILHLDSLTDNRFKQ
jgi:lysophospholipase L1-like esterase